MVNDIREQVSLRLAVAEDEEFLLRLYTAGRSDELKAFRWTDQQIEQFCQTQYRAQTWQHNLTFKGSVDSIVELNGQAIGRLKVLNSMQEILLVDIALLPEFQNLGIGTKFLELLKAEARTEQKRLRLHVLITSRGINLYERLGFKRINEDGAYIEMEFR